MTQANEFINSDPADRVWVGGGWLVRGIHCPKCRSAVLYNGNYFCENWGVDGDACTWALGHPSRTKADKDICDALGIDYG